MVIPSLHLVSRNLQKIWVSLEHMSLNKDDKTLHNRKLCKIKQRSHKLNSTVK